MNKKLFSICQKKSMWHTSNGLTKQQKSQNGNNSQNAYWVFDLAKTDPIKGKCSSGSHQVVLTFFRINNIRFNSLKAGLFEGSFFLGGVNLIPSSYLKKN